MAYPYQLPPAVKSNGADFTQMAHLWLENKVSVQAIFSCNHVVNTCVDHLRRIAYLNNLALTVARYSDGPTDTSRRNIREK